MNNPTVFFYSLLLLFSSAAYAQTDDYFPVEAVVHRPYTVMTVNEADLAEIRSVAELHERYPSDWMRSYERVELTTQQAGQAVTTSGPGAQLTPAQRAALRTHVAGAPLHVRVTYIPENDLSDNPPRTYAFTSAVEPTHAAAFVGGEAALQAYLKREVLDQLPAATFSTYQLAAVRFTLDAEGCVDEVTLTEPTKNAEADRLLLAAVRAMPDWSPATYADGTQAPTERVLAVGDLRSCTANLVGLPPQ